MELRKDNKTINKQIVLAIGNDPHIRELNYSLLKLTETQPYKLVFNPMKFSYEIKYSDEVEELMNKIRSEIESRRIQIMNSFL